MLDSERGCCNMNRKQRLASNIDAVVKRRKTMMDLQEASETVVPYAYCTMVMALQEITNLEQEDIEAIILRSQQIWDCWEYGTESPIDVCERLTGIRLVSRKDAEEIENG